MNPSVLVVEDERPMLRFLRASLDSHGYRVLEATTAAEALLMATTHQPEVILMDLGLPDMDGLELTRRIREWSATPIIVISARGQETDKIKALDAGADDYLTKPFGTGELMARIRVSLRHASKTPGQEEPTFETPDWRMDLARREVWRGAEQVHLTPNEYKLLACLVKHAGKVLTHAALLREVWGNASAQPHYLRVYMAQLRHKLEQDPARPVYLVTEPGVGYRLRA